MRGKMIKDVYIIFKRMICLYWVLDSRLTFFLGLHIFKGPTLPNPSLLPYLSARPENLTGPVSLIRSGWALFSFLEAPTLFYFQFSSSIRVIVGVLWICVLFPSSPFPLGSWLFCGFRHDLYALSFWMLIPRPHFSP